MTTPKFSLLVRLWSTSSSTRQMVKPPVQVFGLDGRYATALYSAAVKQKNLETVEKDLAKFQGALKTDKKLKEFIVNPTIQRPIKVEALKAIASKASLCAETGNLLQLLAENGRLKNLENIINAFKLIMSAHRGEVICEVVTAKELDANQRKQLEAVLKSFVKGKQSIHLSTKVDPSLVGGMTVSIGDRYVDMSIATKLKKYTDLISAPV